MTPFASSTINTMSTTFITIPSSSSVRCVVCSMTCRCYTYMRAGIESIGHVVCRPCNVDILVQAAPGRIAICTHCPHAAIGKVAIPNPVVYTLYQRHHRGQVTGFALCVECMIREMSSNDEQSMAMRDVCTLSPPVVAAVLPVASDAAADDYCIITSPPQVASPSQPGIVAE